VRSQPRPKIGSGLGDLDLKSFLGRRDLPRYEFHPTVADNELRAITKILESLIPKNFKNNKNFI
jgi:hypothetical protein